jgi:hypothetical protein
MLVKKTHTDKYEHNRLSLATYGKVYPAGRCCQRQ